MASPPDREFGRRRVRPAVRGAGSTRAQNIRVVPGVAVGENTRAFLKPGAQAHLGTAPPQARRRLAAVLAVTGGLLYGASLAPAPSADAGKVLTHVVTAGVSDLSDLVVRPFVDHVAATADSLQRDLTRGTMAAGDAASGAARDAVSLAVSGVNAAGAALDAVGKIPDAAGSVVAAARTAAEDWVSTQVAEMKVSAGMIREGLSPAVSQVAGIAGEALDVFIRDLDKQAKLAEIDKTGVVVDLPGYRSYADADERAAAVRKSMAGVVRDVEKTIMARTEVPSEPAVLAFDDDAPVLTQRAAFRVSGDLVHVGGSTIRTDVVSSIAHAAKITGNDPVYLAALAARESSFREHDRATTSSATGLFQFIKDTWLMAVKEFGAKLGLGSVSDEIHHGRRGYVVSNPSRKAAILAMRKDPLVSGLVVSEMERADRKVLEKALGRKATAGERYMSHFLGIADAVRMVSLGRQNPSAPAADYFRKAAKANKSLFYGRNGAKYSVAQVIAGFKNWFEGPNGGMKRYAAFAHAAERVPPPASPQYAVVRKSVAPVATVPVHETKDVQPMLQTASLHVEQPVVAAPKADPVVPSAEIVRKPEPETVTIRTPYKPGKPASYKVGSGRIAGYIDREGRLSSMATSFARQQIIDGFGRNFERLPRHVQDHLRNADRFDVAMLAPYAKLMPRGMRDGLAKEGLTFQDAVAPSGGELVVVAAPHRSGRTASLQQDGATASGNPEADPDDPLPSPGL